MAGCSFYSCNPRESQEMFSSNSAATCFFVWDWSIVLEAAFYIDRLYIDGDRNLYRNEKHSRFLLSFTVFLRVERRIVILFFEMFESLYLLSIDSVSIERGLRLLLSYGFPVYRMYYTIAFLFEFLDEALCLLLTDNISIERGLWLQLSDGLPAYRTCYHRPSFYNFWICLLVYEWNAGGG